MRFTAAIMVLSVATGCTPQSVRNSSPSSRSAPAHPATGPAVANAPPAPRVKADLSTPFATYVTVATAIREGDAETFRAAMIAPEHPEARKHFEAWAQLVTASGRLRRVALRRFGRPAAEHIMNCPVHVLDPSGWGEAELEKLRAEGPESIRINGDEAFREWADFGSGELARVGGQWKLRWSPKNGEDPGVQNGSDFAALFTLGAKFRQYYARQLEAGRFRDAEEAIDEIHRVGTGNNLPEDILRDHVGTDAP